MKMPRRRFWLPLALITALIVWVRFDVPSHILGWFRGDAYYQGLPTSYWRLVIRREYVPPRDWYESVMVQLHYFRRGGLKPKLFTGDVEAIPVLSQIAQDQHEDPQVRSLAAGHLAIAGNPPLDLILAPLRACVDDPDRSMRVRAAELLFYRNVDVPEMSKVLIEAYTENLQNPSKDKRQAALQRLRTVALRNDKMTRDRILLTVSPLLDDQDRDVRGTAAYVVNKIKNHRDDEKQANP